MHKIDELPKRYADAVRFAALCIRQDIEPSTMGHLACAAQSAFRAGVLYSNNSGRGWHLLDQRKARFERLADELGLKVTWPGLYPDLTTKDGYAFTVPYIEGRAT